MQEQSSTVQLHIGGMTCVNCRDKIERELNGTDGVESASVNYGSGVAEITYREDVITEEEIVAVIEGLGYRVLTGERQSGAAKILLPFLLFAVIVAVYLPLQYFGLLNYLAPTDLAQSGMGFGMLFVIGLITSVHCIAMCGGINLSQCIPKSEETAKGFRTFLPALCYNLGRVVSYTVLGFLFGGIGWIAGSSVPVGVSSIVQGFFKIVAGILMILVGVNMLGLVPALRKLNPATPKFLAKRIGKRKSATRNPFLVGILNGFMPCGPLQSMWLVALATENPFIGALSMFLFALGTVPLMLGLGSLVAKLGERFTKTVMTVGALLVVVLGLSMLSQGGGLTGFRFLSPAVLATVVLALLFAGIVCSVPLSQKALKIAVRVSSLCFVLVIGAFAFWLDSRGRIDDTYDVSVIEGEKQTVRSTLSSGSYPKIAVTQGIPVEWIVYAPEGSVNGCNYKIQIPEYGIEYIFRTGENVIEFTPEKTGTFRYSCWMGMIDGTIAVTQ